MQTTDRPLPPDEQERGRDPTWPCKMWGFVHEDAPELTPEQVELHAVADRLEDIRHKLFFAARVRCRYRPEVRALHELAHELHLRVRRELYGEGS